MLPARDTLRFYALVFVRLHAVKDFCIFIKTKTLPFSVSFLRFLFSTVVVCRCVSLISVRLRKLPKMVVRRQLCACIHQMAVGMPERFWNERKVRYVIYWCMAWIGFLSGSLSFTTSASNSKNVT